jgi:hypothetical protein
MSALLPSARMGTFISTLHTILKPFLLRRMKADVLGAFFVCFAFCLCRSFGVAWLFYFHVLLARSPSL